MRIRTFEILWLPKVARFGRWYISKESGYNWAFDIGYLRLLKINKEIMREREKMFLVFVNHDLWIYTEERGTLGPITSFSDITLPIKKDIEIPDYLTLGYIGGPPISRERFLKWRMEQ